MNKKMFLKTALVWLGCLVFGAMLGLGLAMLHLEASRYMEGEEVYRHIADIATEVEHEGDYSAPATSTEPEAKWPKVDFDLLRSTNPDVVAWLYAPDTPLNYPIVQGSDNTYYLNHLFDGSSNKLGCLFVDAENAPPFEDANTVIYGHNMLDNSMLSWILEYQKQSTYDALPYLYLLTPDGDWRIELFSAVRVPADSNSWVRTFDSETIYLTWLQERQGNSMFQSGVLPTAGQKTITLSTCVVRDDDSRFVLYGRLAPV